GDRDVRGLVADGGQGELRVVGVAPGEGGGLQGPGTEAVPVALLHVLHAHTVAAAEEVPVDERVGVQLGAQEPGPERGGAAGERYGRGRERCGAEQPAPTDPRARR